ncbi:Activating signal cointegrator 1 complex subunit 1 [Leucoagaricus sp. SymC.cos]|nr:Activating signal cointegrator 1 complex subunit 1 [Leucoagaricus sp. SymC.cos]
MPPRRQQFPTAPRPTHFLALPLHTHSILRARVANFQESLFDGDGRALVRGLDRTIVIDPRRLHLTLGVMALDGETKRVEDALALLETLRPQLRALLEDRKTVKVELGTLDVLKTERRGEEVHAHVLYLGVSDADEETLRLKRVCDVVHQAFKTAGHIRETRPLKLHCTILNTSHRQPRRREAFSYDDILKITAAQNFGAYDVGRVELWKMGSRGPNNEYVSCGGTSLA